MVDAYEINDQCHRVNDFLFDRPRKRSSSGSPSTPESMAKEHGIRYQALKPKIKSIVDACHDYAQYGRSHAPLLEIVITDGVPRHVYPPQGFLGCIESMKSFKKVDEPLMQELYYGRGLKPLIAKCILMP